MSKRYGIVVCGGESSRMGMDKSLLVYHGQPQRYYLYQLMQPLCDKVFISCNEKQAATIADGYEKIVDAARYQHIGPMAALLSAFAAHPDADLLVLACDYPFITQDDLRQLIAAQNDLQPALSFFNPVTNFAEPLIGLYSHEAYPKLIHDFNQKNYSLKHFLQEVSAQRILPRDPGILQSIDTPEAYQEALAKTRSTRHVPS